ncbi:MAG: methyltransferase [Pseudomonadota bacterium]
MSDATLTGGAAPRPDRRLSGWWTRLIASRGFQRWASRFPLTRRVARAEGEALFDLVAGFVHSQLLGALVEFSIPDMLLDGPLPVGQIAARTGLPEPRALVLLRAGAALGILRMKRGGRVGLTRRGAALVGVPGLADMIRHHRVLYRDLENPADFFRDGSDTELSRFWPYVFGAGSASDPSVAARYSDLMAESQGLVAEETLRAVSLQGVRHLLDVGGGTGAFAIAAAAVAPEARVTVFDLPEVVSGAAQRIAAARLTERVSTAEGSFRDDPLPAGADAISLVRVLYDHSDDTVRALLAKVHATLPPGGRLIVSEPMSGGARPTRAGDAYFAVYTLAMGTGKTRSAREIASLLSDAGFTAVRPVPTHRPFVTSVVAAEKAGART